MSEELRSEHFVLFEEGAQKVVLEVMVDGETIWLTQKKMAELFGVGVPAVNKHLNNIYEEGELIREATLSILETVREEGGRRVSRKLEYYNLDAVIAVGYRVNSKTATRFRIWATGVLREYMVKGFALDDERLKQGGEVFGKDYFEELLEKIREIRASERRFYQKITDIYALAADYDKGAEQTKTFFASVQNKLHWAITGKTAAEIIYDQADAEKRNMGLKTWKNAPEGKILKSDVSVAKNYLDKEHIGELNQLVSAYLDLAENRARRQIVMKMADWAEFLDRFLELSSYPILEDKGKVSAEVARVKAEGEYKKFRVEQDRKYVSDFDKATEKLLRKEKQDGTT